ncbi:flavodoxin family protein [Anaerofustis sp. LCP19S3_F7]|uniref:flavodoxin family protein n=1 Tax=Anaerofustis sp. LCP19S3_F7 TaxID=3440247 RepID=UPI003F8DF67A
MKVALINGQNHKGSSYNTGKILALKLTSEEDIFEIFLPKDFDKYCMGCNSCFMKSERLCPHYELIHPIDEIMKKCDVLIFTTPTYVFHMSGQLKGFLDHFGYRWIVHRPEAIMFKKTGCLYFNRCGNGNKESRKGNKRQFILLGNI